MTSHKDCTHPSTKADRQACRKGLAAIMTPDGMPTDPTIKTAPAPKPATAAAQKKAKAVEANAARLAATKAKAATKQRATKTDCYICSTPAGWIEKSTGEPICMKHVDFKNALILPL
jgi:hypothetical protein